MSIRKLLIVGLLCATSLFAGDGKFQDDPITGKKSLTYINRQKTLRFEYQGGDVIDFYTSFSYNGEQNVSIPSGSQIFFKMKNDSIVTLLSTADAAPKTQVYSSYAGAAAIVSVYTFPCKITKKQLENMAGSSIAFIRYPSTDGGTIDYDIKLLGKVYASQIAEGAQFMLSNLSKM